VGVVGAVVVVGRLVVVVVGTVVVVVGCVVVVVVGALVVVVVGSVVVVVVATVVLVVEGSVVVLVRAAGPAHAARRAQVTTRAVVFRVPAPIRLIPKASATGRLSDRGKRHVPTVHFPLPGRGERGEAGTNRRRHHNMLFPTVTFAVFFTGVFVAFWLTRGKPGVWKWVLVAAGWVFYAWWDWRFVFLLAGSITVNHLVAGAIARYGSRPWLPIGVVANVGVLGFFKYYNFFLSTLVDLTQAFGWSPPRASLQVLLPIGISFFTFEAISYLIEVSQGKVGRLRLLDLAAYLSFFPKLTSGPITRASEFAPQLEAPAEKTIEASTAFWLIARGLFKKMVVAAYLADAVTSGVFAAPGQYSGLEVLVGVYAYTAEIYLDFSAYTDMAIGLALLLGFRLPENFDRPYTQLTVTAFWAHWHMTLTRWMRDFVFTPLVARGRATTGRTMWSLFLVMMITGVWHGAGWTFVVFGAIHGAVMALERLDRVRRRAAGRPPTPIHPVGRALRWLLTFHVVVLGWVFFRADSIGAASDVITRIFGGGAGLRFAPVVLLIIAATVATQFLPAGVTDRVRARFASLRPVYQAVVLGVFLLFVDALGPVGVPPFIYFRF